MPRISDLPAWTPLWTEVLPYSTSTTSKKATFASLPISDATQVALNAKWTWDGTVTSVAAITLWTTGTDLSSSVSDWTTTPVITLNVPTASAANRGALSSADWSTFNGKAPTASPTFTGTVTTPAIKITGWTPWVSKVLTSDIDWNWTWQDPSGATSTTSAVRAYNSANQTWVVSWAATKVLLNTEEFDEDSEFTSSTFTAKQAGIYIVSWQVRWAWGWTGQLTTFIYKNGAVYVDFSISGLSTYTTQPVNSVIKLAINDTIELYARHYAGSDQTITWWATLTFLSISKIA